MFYFNYGSTVYGIQPFVQQNISLNDANENKKTTLIKDIL